MQSYGNLGISQNWSTFFWPHGPPASGSSCKILKFGISARSFLGETVAEGYIGGQKLKFFQPHITTMSNFLN